MGPMRPHRPANRAFVTLLAAGVAALAACGGGGPAVRAALTGSFDLESVDGQPLPYAFPMGLTAQVMSAARLEFLSRGRLLDIRELWNGTVPETDTAVYAYRLAGSTLVVLHTSFDTLAAYNDTAVVSGDGAIALRVMRRVSTMGGSSGNVYYEFLYRPRP
jgi:hypothetical protein